MAAIDHFLPIVKYLKSSSHKFLNESEKLLLNSNFAEVNLERFTYAWNEIFYGYSSFQNLLYQYFLILESLLFINMK